MNITAHKDGKSSILSIFMGFLALFIIYHLPEFFQNYYHQPLLWLLELGMLAFVITAFFIGKYQKKNGLAAFGLHDLATHYPNTLKGLCFGVFMVAFATYVTFLLGWNTVNVTGSLSSIILNTIMFAAGTILPSLAEDILTRGYLFAHAPANTNRYFIIIGSGLLFALNHIYRLDRPDVVLYLFILGVLLMWCLIYTKNLWLTFGIHWGTNIAYQFFNNVLSQHIVRETGLDNYILGGCYLVGISLIWVLFKAKVFKIS